MLKAHRRAWLWQDEWYGLTMDDIREIERQTQEILRNKMAAIMGPVPSDADQEDKSDTQQQEQNQTQQQRANDNLNTSSLASIGKSEYDNYLLVIQGVLVIVQRLQMGDADTQTTQMELYLPIQRCEGVKLFTSNGVFF